MCRNRLAPIVVTSVIYRTLKKTTQHATAATQSGRLGEGTLRDILGYQLAQAAIISSGVFEALVGAPLKLRPVEYTILMLVKENAGVSPAQLSKALEVTRPNISVWIDKLEARGLVKREQNTSDR